MTRSLRVQVRTAIVLAAVAALVLLGAPLAIAVARLTHTQALTGLQRDAVRAVAAVPDNVVESGTKVRLPAVAASTRLAVYDAHGARVQGIGPAHSTLAVRTGADGREHDGNESGGLAVVVPILSDTTVAGSVRAAVPQRDLHRLVLLRWAELAALAGLALVVALTLARRSARTISEPFEQLTALAEALAEGRSVALPAHRVREVDEARQALERSAREVEQLLAHEREFVRDASHQLRTPLAALLLALDRPDPDVGSALLQSERLTMTVADLVALRGLETAGSCDPVAVAAESARRWNALCHEVRLRADDVGTVEISEPALRQALDVLLDNAARHGSDPITVTVEPYDHDVLVEVQDSGSGFPGAYEEGTGLTLARRVVQRAGGSLVIRHAGRSPRIALLVPGQLDS